MGSMTERVRIAALSEIPVGSSHEFTAAGRVIALYNVDGTLYAMDDLCSHDLAWLSEGSFDPKTRAVRCPKHTSTFDVTTGRPKTLPAIKPVKTYATKIEEGRILLLLDS